MRFDCRFLCPVFLLKRGLASELLRTQRHHALAAAPAAFSLVELTPSVRCSLRQGIATMCCEAPGGPGLLQHLQD